MKIFSVHDQEFLPFGRVLDGDYSRILFLLQDSPMPEEGTSYVASDPRLEEKEILEDFQKRIYGHMDVQIGYTNGHNQRLNCLEFHKGNEVNMANEDFILLLGSYFDIKDGKYDTSNVKAFRVPAGVAVEIYSTTLHYAPCGIDGSGFKVLVVLPKGTNSEHITNVKDPWLWGTNKWLLAHPSSNEARQGAYIGLVGENIFI